MTSIDLKRLNDLRESGESFYIYFSAPGCTVCEVLYSKLNQLMKEAFPKLKAFHSNTGEDAELAAQLGLYTNPSLLVFMDGNEVLRRSRAIGLGEVETVLGRYYTMHFK